MIINSKGRVGDLMKVSDLTLKVHTDPWYPEMVAALRVFVDRCQKAGVPVKVVQPHIDAMIKDGAREAINLV